MNNNNNNNLLADLVEYLNSDEAKKEFEHEKNVQIIEEHQYKRYVKIWKTLDRNSKIKIITSLNNDQNIGKYQNINSLFEDAAIMHNYFKECDFYDIDDNWNNIYDIDGIALYVMNGRGFNIKMLDDNSVVPHVIRPEQILVYNANNDVIWKGDNELIFNDILSQIAAKKIKGYTFAYGKNPDKKIKISSTGKLKHNAWKH